MGLVALCSSQSVTRSDKMRPYSWLFDCMVISEVKENVCEVQAKQFNFNMMLSKTLWCSNVDGASLQRGTLTLLLCPLAPKKHRLVVYKVDMLRTKMDEHSLYLPPNQLESGKGFIKGIPSCPLFITFITIFLGILGDISSMIIYSSHQTEPLPATATPLLHTFSKMFRNTFLIIISFVYVGTVAFLMSSNGLPCLSDPAPPQPQWCVGSDAFFWPFWLKVAGRRAGVSRLCL